MSTTNTAHTPGPWHVAYYGDSERQIVKRGSLSLAELLAWSSGPESKAQVEANARLIAAAPELLAALEKSYALLADIRHNWVGRETYAGQALLCSMRDTIAKATDRDPCEVSTGNRSEILEAL